MLCLPNLAIAAGEDGWDTGLDVTVEGSAGLHGGTQRAETMHGLALVHADWRQPAAPAEGLICSGYISALALAGKGPTERFLGDFLATSNIEGFPSVRLYSWWVQTDWREWTLRSGALLADEEFGGTEAGGNFINSAFGWPAFISANTVNTGPAFYVAAPGIRLERKWGETGAWRLGAYDGDSFDSPAGDPRVTRHGLHYRVGGSQGWFLITEAMLAPAGGATRFKLGAWLHTAAFAHVRDDASGQAFAVSGNAPREFGSNHGAYAAIERTLAGESGKPGNIELFVRSGLSPSDRNAISWALDTGIGWTGLIPGRPTDVAALGLAHARFGSCFADAARLTDPANPAPDFEQAIELTYSIDLSEHLTIQPDLQFIRHPGGSPAQRDAVLFHLRINTSF